MAKNFIVSLVTMRLYFCPKSAQYQRILAYGYLADRRRYEFGPGDKGARYLYTYGSNVEKIGNRIIAEGYQTEPSEPFQQKVPIFAWDGTPDGPDFSRDCLKRSFCHIAAKARDMRTAKVNLYREESNICLNQPYFGISVCIENEPGTIYALLSMLTAADDNEMKEPLNFDFNVDHLRTCLCRATDCVKMDLYGHFRGSSTNQPIESSTNQNSLDRLTNIKAMVFYDVDCRATWRDGMALRDGSALRKLLQSYPGSFYSEKPCRQGSPFETLVYINNAVPPNPLADHECPVARLAGCFFEASKEKPVRPSFDESPIKIEVCLRNTPGALRWFGKKIAAKTDD